MIKRQKPHYSVRIYEDDLPVFKQNGNKDQVTQKVKEFLRFK